MRFKLTGNINNDETEVSVYPGDIKNKKLSKKIFKIFKLNTKYFKLFPEIKKSNEYTSSLPIRKFRMLTKELDHEDGDLTATQKAKRNVIMEKFSDLIEDMYK